MFDELPAAPQSIGDLIGRSFRIYRRQIGAVFRVLLGPTILAALGALGIQFFFYHMLDNSIKPAYLAYIAFGLSILLVAAAKWMLTIRQLAFVRLTAGFDTSFESANRLLGTQKWKVLLLCLAGIFTLILFTAFWGTILVGSSLAVKVNPILAALAAIFLIICPFGIALSLALVVLVLFLSFCVLACEGGGTGTTLRRGVSLTLGDFWRAFAFGLLLYVVLAALTIPLSVPLLIASGFDMYQHGLTSPSDYESYQMPLYLMVISHAWEALLNMLLWPVAFMSFGLLYQDLRLRQEGLDISRQLESLTRKAV